MTIGDPICPMPDRRPGSVTLERTPDGKVRFSGFHRMVYFQNGAAAVCVKCSKTWKRVGDEMVATWPEA